MCGQRCNLTLSQGSPKLPPHRHAGKSMQPPSPRPLYTRAEEPFISYVLDCQRIAPFLWATGLLEPSLMLWNSTSRRAPELSCSPPVRVFGAFSCGLAEILQNSWQGIFGEHNGGGESGPTNRGEKFKLGNCPDGLPRERSPISSWNGTAYFRSATREICACLITSRRAKKRSLGSSHLHWRGFPWTTNRFTLCGTRRC